MGVNFILAVNRIVRQIEAEVGLDAVTPRARILLRVIAEQEIEGNAPRIGDLVALSRLGTPPTIYSSLGELEEGGWIERRPDRIDARARRIHVTGQARKAFARMSKLIQTELGASDPTGK